MITDERAVYEFPNEMAGERELIQKKNLVDNRARGILDWVAGWRLPVISLPVYYLLGFVAVIAVTPVLIVPLYLMLRAAGAVDETVTTLLQPATWGVLLRTLWLAGSVTAATIILAVPAAWLTVRTDLPGRRVWAILVALPLVLPSYVASYVFMTVLAPKGLLQQVIQSWTGIDRLPSLTGFPGAFLVLTLITYPFVYLPVRATLHRMDPALLEVARSLGASPWSAFRRVIMPYLRPSLAAGGLLVALYVMRDFGAVTMWQYSTFTRVIYNRYLGYKLDAAAALALCLVLLTLILVVLESRSRGQARYDRQSVGSARNSQPIKLGRWRYPALGFLGFLVFSSLILPAAGLCVWLWRGWQNEAAAQTLAAAQGDVTPWIQLLVPAWNSFSISTLAALLVTGAALPVAMLLVRRPGMLSHFLERLTYMSYALPGLVVALALVFFGLNFAGALYQTLPVLLIAYLILFLPQAIGAQRASLLQVKPALEEAGRSLGLKPLEVLRSITVPLVRPGLFAGAMLVFLTSMKELPAALILSPIGYTTLATQVWSNISEAFFARAAAPTLLLLLLSSLPLALMSLRDDQ